MNKKATFLNKFQSLLLAQIENARARKAEDEMAMSENKRENHCDNVALLLHPKPKKPRHVKQQSAGSTHVIHKGADGKFSGRRFCLLVFVWLLPNSSVEGYIAPQDK